MTWRSAATVLGAAATAVACASCSSSGSPASSGPPTSEPPSPTQTRLTAQQAAPLIVQCFVDHHLIPASALATGNNEHPPFDSSAWLRHGKVIANGAFSAWFAESSAVVVRGKSIGDWMTAIEISRKNWPTSICGPVPG
jgi:hypothetical protein